MGRFPLSRVHEFEGRIGEGGRYRQGINIVRKACNH